mmetsp:Transcript_69679/g.123350  ORF Transcript_69679/g.123350 Transcript_69679/m.123350 type:complete len:309 (-) Transcript_69679:323-1249(-)|eukprot:CAMPEP_0197636528 /NCGR_PEP_ID=MMETSP1338-20131121/12001_1 /TAXON_ID=43686 ORGANISM="Pelagodinium beii, Strain RCC1491" /NCGR_SAMPLE_ID=MMETSP1338 /ASSEMBLY_ACC=CAM_ASM_000754 /LENGTH=308 /DNA_ID=CAMNT_0043208769 /DNA_START=71 /DNA_END=997 /DNA_ORIENTATION=-
MVISVGKAFHKRRPHRLFGWILTLWAAGVAFVGPSPRPRGSHAPQAEGQDVLSEVYLNDVSPKGRTVISAYKELLSLNDDSESAVAGIMERLDGEQKDMLRGLIKARGGQDREITDLYPEVGDTIERLHKKYMMLPDDDAVVAWRLKLDPALLNAMQGLIEKKQMELADEEGSKALEDEADADEAWKLFQAQFPKAAERELYMTTPCRSTDIRYRFRRLKESLEIDSATALQIIGRDCTPMFVDPEFIRRTFKAMVKVIGKEDALENVVLKHPGSLVTQPQNVEKKIDEIKLGANVINAFASIGNMFR